MVDAGAVRHAARRRSPMSASPRSWSSPPSARSCSCCLGVPSPSTTSYRGISGEVRELAASHRLRARAGLRPRARERPTTSRHSVLNPRTLEDPGTVYAFDAGPTNRAAVVAHFPDRRSVGRRPRRDEPGQRGAAARDCRAVAAGHCPGVARSISGPARGDEPAGTFARNHLQQLQAGVDVMCLTLAADPLGLVGANFADPVAVLGELDRSLRRETSGRLRPSPSS